MASLSGIISLQEAMNGDTLSIPSINRQQLELGPIVEYTPRHKCHYQPISYGGQKLRIQTPAVKMTSLIYHTYSCGDAILISISKWLRQQFNILDEFVRTTFTIPKKLKCEFLNTDHLYKPIQDGENIYLIMDETCTMTQDTEDGIVEITPKSRPSFGEGHYSLAIEFSHVYIGYHYLGHLYSVNYRVKHVHFKPLSYCSSTHNES